MSKTQRKNVVERQKRIFYTNITYGCNSNCVFCYSHNTKHTQKTYKEISKEILVEYWNRMGVGKNDRIIINGGEPLLHTKFEEILNATHRYGCEVLVYTNGRLLNKLNPSLLVSNYRFVVPIHGYEKLHDSITRVNGSYHEMIEGIKNISESKALVDLKIIINYQMAVNMDDYSKTVDALLQLPALNAIHITKMADTIISQRNKCLSVTPKMSACCTKNIYELFKDKYTVKLFDTCIREIVTDSAKVCQSKHLLKVFFKDVQYEFDVKLKKPYLNCMDTCLYKDICQSAVGEYTVLEAHNGNFFVGLE